MELVGREVLVSQMTHELANDIICCGLVTGSPGFGKTAVAVAVAHGLLEGGTMGTFVSLQSVSTYKGVIQQLLMALQCGVTTGQESPSGQVFQVGKLVSATSQKLDVT